MSCRRRLQRRVVVKGSGMYSGGTELFVAGESVDVFAWLFASPGTICLIEAQELVGAFERIVLPEDPNLDYEVIRDGNAVMLQITSATARASGGNGGMGGWLRRQLMPWRG